MIPIPESMEEAELRSVMSDDVCDLYETVKKFDTSPFAVANGIKITKVSKDEVKLSMEMLPGHYNTNGVAHGGAVFAIIDQVFAIASNLFEPAVGQNTFVTYHRPAVGKSLEAVSKNISDTRSLSVFEIKVYSAGKHIATGMCTAFKTNAHSGIR